MEGQPVLPDTSVWIEHFKGKTDIIERLFIDDTVTIVTHPFVVTELVLGGLKEDDPKYHQLNQQVMLKVIADDNLQIFISDNSLSCKGVGYVDCSLLASCVNNGATMVTLDKKLAEVAKLCGVLWHPMPHS